MQTRRDFRLAADSIRRQFEQARTEREKDIVRKLAEDMAGNFRASNPRFDRSRFYDACGFNG